MGRPQVRLQTESETDRRFTTIRVKRNGRVSYHKVYLRTKEEEVARRRLIALDGVDDPEEAATGSTTWPAQAPKPMSG